MLPKPASVVQNQLSIVRGSPLEDEPGMGALTIAGYLREVVSRFGPREALVMHGPQGVERWSYDTLWQKSMDVAKALVAAGAGKDSRVGVLMTNRPEYLSTVFGCGLVGAVSVGLSTFSTLAELEQLVALSGVSLVLFDSRVLKKDFGAMLLEIEPQLAMAKTGELRSIKFPFLNRLVRLPAVTPVPAEPEAQASIFETWDSFLAAGREIPDALIEARAATVAPADAGGLFFSSGTTSLPKGILHTQRAFAIQWWRWPRVMSLEGEVRSWTGNGFFWSGNITMNPGVALSTGGAVVLQPYFEAEGALRLMQEERVSYVAGRPHQWARLQEAPNWSTTDLSTLRWITNGELLHTHPTVSSRWMVPMTYGTTETMTSATSYSADTGPEHYAGSAGEPLPGNILKIVDPDTREVVARGQRGEICLKGPTLMIGYIGKAPEECFDEDGYYCTGDGGYVDDLGRLYWEGRLTEIIKTGGANVSPIEIDAVLSLYPGVRRAQTVGVPHPTLSEMVVSCVVPQDGAMLDSQAITAFLKDKLASFKVPKAILFFADDEVAVTGNGKVKSNELRALAQKRLASA